MAQCVGEDSNIYASDLDYAYPCTDNIVHLSKKTKLGFSMAEIATDATGDVRLILDVSAAKV